MSPPGSSEGRLQGNELAAWKEEARQRLIAAQRTSRRGSTASCGACGGEGGVDEWSTRYCSAQQNYRMFLLFVVVVVGGGSVVVGVGGSGGGSGSDFGVDVIDCCRCLRCRCWKVLLVFVVVVRYSTTTVCY